jgi:hypothetical protein
VPTQVGGRRSPYADRALLQSSAGTMEQQHYNMDPPMNMSYRQPPQQQMQQQEPYRLHGMENSMPTQAPILPAVGSHPTYHHQQPPPPPPEQDYRKSTSTLSLSSFDSSSQIQAGKPKLPHGLTVHELKEMTKARLQAEAVEQKDGFTGQPNESHAPVPSTVNVGQQEHRDPHQMSRSQVSPIPPGFHGHRMNSVSPYPDNLDHQNRFAHEGWSPESRGGADAWETASVNSAASDYLPPDAAFPANFHAGTHSVDDYSFGRTRSYPASGNSNYAPHELIQVPGGAGGAGPTGYYDGYSPNRRRAATLSPRPGLTHLHEDRPVLSGDGGPGIPSFSSSSSRRAHLPVRTRGAYNADAYHYPRQRTSSTTSLPAISHTAEEFAGGEESPSLFSQFESLREDDDAGHSVTGLVDVFRGFPANYNGMSSPPPGLGGGDSDRLVMSTSSSNGFGSFGDERTRASTWSGHTSDFFGPGLFDSRNDDQDGLAGDLALILKLSGAEEKPDAVGSFYPPGL